MPVPDLRSYKKTDFFTLPRAGQHDHRLRCCPPLVWPYACTSACPQKTRPISGQLSASRLAAAAR